MFFASLGDSSFLPPSDPPDPLMAISSPALPLLTVVTSHRFHTRPLMEWETPPPLTAPPASLALGFPHTWQCRPRVAEGASPNLPGVRQGPEVILPLLESMPSCLLLVLVSVMVDCGAPPSLPAPPPGSGLSQRVSVPQIHSCCSPIVWAVRLSPYHTCVYTRPISICCSFAQFPCGVRWSFGSIFHRLRCRWGSGKGSKT